MDVTIAWTEVLADSPRKSFASRPSYPYEAPLLYARHDGPPHDLFGMPCAWLGTAPAGPRAAIEGAGGCHKAHFGLHLVHAAPLPELAAQWHGKPFQNQLPDSGSLPYDSDGSSPCDSEGSFSCDSDGSSPYDPAGSSPDDSADGGGAATAAAAALNAGEAVDLRLYQHWSASGPALRVEAGELERFGRSASF